MKKNIIAIALSVVIIIFLLFTVNPFVIISAGNRGVVLNWGAVSNIILDEGIHFRVPISQKVVEINVQTQKIEVNVSAYSKDIQTVESRIALNYHITPDAANKLYQEIGLDYENKIINPAIQESVKATTAKFNAQELIEERAKVKEDIKSSLKDRLAIWNIMVDEFSIANFDFSEQYEQAVEAKQTAQQNALKAKNDLERIKFEAEQQITRAKAEAETIRIQAAAITQQGGKDYVQLKAVERWDGKLPSQMIPDAVLPFLNLTK